MSNTVFDQMLSRYTIQTEDDRINALHEVMQQVTLAGLYRAGFFNKTAFYNISNIDIANKIVTNPNIDNFYKKFLFDKRIQLYTSITGSPDMSNIWLYPFTITPSKI